MNILMHLRDSLSKNDINKILKKDSIGYKKGALGVPYLT